MFTHLVLELCSNKIYDIDHADIGNTDRLYV